MLLFWTVLSLDAGQTTVSIQGEEFLINGQPTYAGQTWQGHPIQGRLMNARLVQATFDDRNPETVSRWAYPDTGRWDPERNTREFIAAMPEWKRHGLLAFTVNLQGGSPQGYSREQPWHNSMIEADGSLRTQDLVRLERILNRADELGMVVILGLFYFGQDERLTDEAAVIRAVDQTVDWLFRGGWNNVLIEINNECNVRYDHAILRPDRVHELIERVKATTRDGRRFLVSTSYGGGTVPGTNVVQAADFLLLHGNGVGAPAGIRDLVRKTRSRAGDTPKPILFNEDDHFDFERPDNNFIAAVSERAGWGYFDYRMQGEGFDEGFQSVPVNWGLSSARKRGFFRLLAEITGSPIHGAVATTDPAARWWKGNLHTHSLWSDGDDYPEMIAAWYRDQGYHFLALSDHNTLHEGQRWISATTNRAGGSVLEKYRTRFGTNWVERRSRDGVDEVRLKTLPEFRSLLEEPGRFLMIPAEEITSGYLSFPVHINVTNVRDKIAPAGGTNVTDVIQRTVNGVLAQRAATGQPMFPHINHPNFGWGITAEDLVPVQGERFFEVYNGHPMVHNDGDATHASLDRMWDILLTWRLGILGLPPMYGLAVDDSHSYHAESVSLSNPGRGWVMVRSVHLTAESLIRALEDGDFYASSGVRLEDVRRTGNRLQLVISPDPGATYRTRFIGTRRGFKPTREPYRSASGELLRLTHRYDDDVGEVLAEVDGLTSAYEFGGDELYVRAKVVSSRLKANPYRPGEVEAAWTQPVIP
jgi:hypothetical protein